MVRVEALGVGGPRVQVGTGLGVSGCRFLGLGFV